MVKINCVVLVLMLSKNAILQMIRVLNVSNLLRIIIHYELIKPVSAWGTCLQCFFPSASFSISGCVFPIS
jgi:hypothetical protein